MAPTCKHSFQPAQPGIIHLSMNLSVLNVAYPFAVASRDSVGGAEQVLSAIDGALVKGGHRSIVVACKGSRSAGVLVESLPGNLPPDLHEAGYAMHSQAIGDTLKRFQIDLVHMHGVDFYKYMPQGDVPVLVTLHLPLDWYPSAAFSQRRPNTWFHCVSWNQHLGFIRTDHFLPPIENGVESVAGDTGIAKENFVMSLGRICPEKGYHLAMDAAKMARVRFFLAGEVFQHTAHRQYFQTEIAPRLGRECRFIGGVTGARKSQLLSAARALLVPSLVAETSSLVAMEALACGTPVVACPSGALRTIIEHGKTGFLVNTVEEMADAIAAVHSIDPDACREAARTRFSVETMTQNYLHRYESLVEGKEKDRSQSSPELIPV